MSSISLTADFSQLVAGWREVAASGKYAEGDTVRFLEDAVSEGQNLYAAALNSCGSGLFALASVLKTEARQTAIIPNNTFYATGAMFREAGWDIVLADCAVDDFCITPGTIRQAARQAVSPIGAVVLTHVGGMATRYAEIACYCARKGWTLIEDAAHTLGVSQAGLRPGDLSTAAVYSLYPTKAIPAGEGGLVVAHSEDLINAVKEFRSYGKYADEDGVIRYSRGFNLRMDEWNAVVALAQLKVADQILAERHECAQKLMRVIPPLTTWGGATNWYKYPVTNDFPATKQTGKIYALTDQSSVSLGIGGYFPWSERLANTHICLPVGCGLYDGLSTDEIAQLLTKGLP